MELIVDLGAASVLLGEPEDTGSFRVRIAAPAGATPAEPGDVAALGALLEGSGVGRLRGPAAAFVSAEALRERAAGQVSPGWEERFAAMCAYAAAKGWIDPDDGAIEAHVVWPGSAG